MPPSASSRDGVDAGRGEAHSQQDDEPAQNLEQHQQDGLVHVQLRDKDFVADEVNLIQATLLSPPAGTDQILLRLGHNAGPNVARNYAGTRAGASQILRRRPRTCGYRRQTAGLASGRSCPC